MKKTLHHYLTEAKIGIPTDLPDLPMLFEPRPHQVSGLNQCLRHDRFGLFDQQGTGKTCVMQAYSLVHRWNGYRSIIVMPPILLEQYEESLFDTFMDLRGFVTTHQMEQGPKGRTELYDKWNHSQWPDFMLMSYQMFNKKEIQEMVVPHYNIFIADEAQFLRGRDSNVHNTFYDLTDDHKESALLLATGTPIHTTPEDAYGVVRLINRTAYSSERNFNNTHIITENIRIALKRPIHGRHWTIQRRTIGYRNLSYLKKALYKHGRRVLRRDVLPIDEPTMIEIPVHLHQKHLTLYRRFMNTRFLELEDGDILAAETAQALRQELLRMVSNGHAYTDSLSVRQNRIFEAIRTIIASDPGEKITLFANLRMTIEELAKEFKEYNPALAYGGMGGSKQNRKQVNRFLTDPECRMLIANPKSAGAGLNLQSVCYRAVFVEPTSIPGDFKQASDRFTREGQKNPVIIYVLRPMDTIASYITQVMQEREGFFLQTNPDKSSFIMEAQGKSIAEVRAA